MNAGLDRRHVRRPLSVDEFAKLNAAAEAGPAIQNVSGPDRAILYIVGAYTGYRRNEIASVTKSSFDFDADPPTLTVQAGYSKHRRTDVIPLRKDFADRVQAWIERKGDLRPNQPLFKVANKRTAEMIKADLAAARKDWILDAEGEEDRQRREKSSFLLYKPTFPIRVELENECRPF